MRIVRTNQDRDKSRIYNIRKYLINTRSNVLIVIKLKDVIVAILPKVNLLKVGNVSYLITKL